MPCHQIVPGDFHHLIQNGFGDPGEVVADLHQRQHTGDVRRRHPQGVDLAEDAQGFNQVLRVIVGHRGQLTGKARVQGIGAGGGIERAWIQQFVQQHRMAAQKGGDPGTGTDQPDQVGQGVGIFEEQGQIADSLLDAFQQLEHATQHGFGIVASPAASNTRGISRSRRCFPAVLKVRVPGSDLKLSRRLAASSLSLNPAVPRSCRRSSIGMEKDQASARSGLF